MCRAQPAPPAKSGSLWKMQASLTTRVLVAPSSVSSTPLSAALLVVLPVPWFEPGEGVENGLHVVVVDEVGAVAAAALGEIGRVVVEHALATGAVDAAPVGTQERGVEHPRASVEAILEADPLVKIERPTERRVGGVSECLGTRRNYLGRLATPWLHHHRTPTSCATPSSTSSLHELMRWCRRPA